MRTARNTMRLGLVLVLMLGSLLILEPPARAVPDAVGVVIDDFNDGDTTDWGFFGGNNAGGGGGPADDRPYEGGFYLSTGWGGNGTASGFYGGGFRNFDDGAQPVPPTDPWLNVWVLNQSNATVDQYTLEITVREDTDGDGWTAGAEDSFRLDTTFTAADFDDTWTLLSAPLTSLTDLGTGGNGTFDGNLDEVVIVMGGVVGGEGSAIEVDFDLFAFSSGGPLALDEVVFDDMEHGNPGANGWFSFPGSVGGGGINTDGDVPPGGGASSLITGWGSGGTPGFYGGFGRTNPVDISGTDHFNFWIKPEAGQEYTLEINLQDDDSSNGTIESPDDDEFQFNCVVSAAGPCAVAGGGWQLVSVPLDDFVDDNTFLTGGNGVLDPTAPGRGGNGELINVVIAVIGSGSDVNFRTDEWTFTRGPAQAPFVPSIIDDFVGGVPSGVGPCPAGGLPIGFCTFQGAGSSVGVGSVPEPSPRPGAPSPNGVLLMDLDVTSFAGFIHGFEGAPGEWTPRNWSTSEGISFWMLGTGSGTTLFIDVLDNRNPGSIGDDAERWTVAFADDFVGWELLEFPFDSFTRKEIGNGAPNDGFGRFEIHGYAIGSLDTDGPLDLFVDDVALYGEAAPPAVSVQFAQQNTFITEGTTGQVIVKLNRPLGPEDPDVVTVDYATERSNAIAGEDYEPTSGTLTFERGGPSELSFDVETHDNTKFEGDKQVVIRLTNAVGAERGALFQGSVLIEDDDPFDPKVLDDFEQGAFLWDTIGPAAIEAARSEDTAPSARPGQDPVENIGVITAPVAVDVVVQGKACLPGNGVVPVHVLSTPEFDATTIDHTTVTFGGASETHVDRKTGEPHRHEQDVDRDGDVDLVFHVRSADIDDCAAAELDGSTFAGHPITSGGSDAALVHDFPIGQDWTGTESLTFWYLGDGGGHDVTVTLKDNRAPDPGPSGWDLVWADEFDGAPGTAPDPANWSYELGDTTPDGKNGWGNDELQYYTADNAATDGDGNLVITLDEADGSQECYYGPCEFESARLITQHKAEFAHGRIESRLRVPGGGDGLWPAFWSLGTDITYNPWPGAGEIDIMEYVSRLPGEIFGTIHGPGYSGGASFGGIYDFGTRVDSDYHTFAVEWQPNLITWYVDGIEYHQADPADVAGPWVFEKPFFLLLNFAIGGNFGGAVDPDTVYPQEYLVDYVRVYQGPDTAERFEATFTDSVAGWQEVSVPISAFTRSADQPDGAPDDGLGLTEVWGYGLSYPDGTASGAAAIDFVRRVSAPAPTDLVVTTLDDDGDGSLRDALTRIADGGSITFDPSLAGGTLTLTSGQLSIDRDVSINASTAPLTISGGGASRVLSVAPGSEVSVSHVVIRDGVAAPQGGGVFNLGDLTLDHVVVTANTQSAPGPADFQFGGGGIYNGDGASLRLVDSTVSDNVSVTQPGGGIYGFFNSTVEIERSTVSGNLSGDVAGGLRSLGDVTVTNSTFSGNTSSAWHGGGIFHTDGSLVVTNSTFAENVAPPGTASGILVATFGAPADMTITNSIVEGFGGAFACAIEGGAAATIVSGGYNVIGDGSCNPTGPGDQPSTDALLGPLADNGGPTLTHALLAGSPAIDAGSAGACPVVDQRGVPRPIGVGCDAGAYEWGP